MTLAAENLTLVAACILSLVSLLAAFGWRAQKPRAVEAVTNLPEQPIPSTPSEPVLEPRVIKPEIRVLVANELLLHRKSFAARIAQQTIAGRWMQISGADISTFGVPASMATEQLLEVVRNSVAKRPRRKVRNSLPMVSERSRGRFHFSDAGDVRT